MNSNTTPSDGFETIRYERGRVSTVRLHRPDKHNAIDAQLRDELVTAAEDFDRDEESSVLVIAGSGGSFSAGADIDELRRRRTDQLAEDASVTDALSFEPFRLASRAIDDVRKPVIAMIDGYCLGGGLELALACDVRLAADRAEFGTPEINLGKFPADGGTQRLPRETNQGAAMLMILSGEPIGAERAREYGIVQGVHPHESLEERTMELAETIASHPTPSLILAKRAVSLAGQTELSAGLDLELLLDDLLEVTPERRRKLDEFLDE